MTTMPATTSTPKHWDDALEWSAYLESVEQKRDLWLANKRRAKVGEAEAARLAALPGARRVLVLTEDWCGDAIRSVPSIATALASAPDVEVRFLPIDSFPDAVDGFLTHGGRAIPIVLVYDEQGTLLGAWGPRPAPLQAMLRDRMATEGRPTSETMGEFYAPIMAWYAQDRGVTVIQELLMLLERGGAPR